MWNEYHRQSDLSLDIELTTYCNARCPQCSRTDQNDVNKRKHWLPLKQVTYNQFKKWFPKVSGIRNFHFSGKFGDPGMCKDLYEIVKYILDSDETTTVSVNTNGSMRDEDFWFDFASLGKYKPACEYNKGDKERLHIIFDVDGIDQDMHSFYRRGTSLDKVLKHIKVACQTLSKVSVLTVMFKHNEDYIEDIQNMCKKLGVKHFDTVEGNNFQDGPEYLFVDENGKQQVLEQITRKDREQGLERTNRVVRDHRHDINYKEIVCAAAREKNLQVSSNGLVMPCCHLSALENHKFASYNKEDEYLSTYGDYEMNNMLSEYINKSDDFNLNHKSIDDIVNNIWYVESLKNSWSSKDTASYACKKVCGKC